MNAIETNLLHEAELAFRDALPMIQVLRPASKTLDRHATGGPQCCTGRPSRAALIMLEIVAEVALRLGMPAHAIRRHVQSGIYRARPEMEEEDRVSAERLRTMVNELCPLPERLRPSLKDQLRALDLY